MIPMEMKKDTFDKVIAILHSRYPEWDAPAKKSTYDYDRTPFTITISVILSFRTKDEVTQEAGKRLFALADTPEKMLTLSKESIEKTIYPVGFYRKKAQSVLEISRYLIDRFDGKVPNSEKELLKIKGIGPKAAAIILERAFGRNIVAVDTHVHRILNLWGFLNTDTPQSSYEILKALLDDKEKRGLNRLLVAFGQTICRPQRPRCEVCPVQALCPNPSI